MFNNFDRRPNATLHNKKVKLIEMSFLFIPKP